MDNFHQITQNVRSNDVKTATASVPRSGIRQSASMLSDDALEKILETLKQKQSGSSDLRTRANFQSQIDSIEKELIKRRGAIKKEVVEDIKSVRTQEKMKQIGGNVGFGALAFGVFSYIIGDSQGSNKAIWWGLGGAVVGGVGVFIISNLKSSSEEKGIKKMEEKK